MKKSIFLLVAAFIANTAIQAQTCLSNELAYRIKNEGFANSDSPTQSWKKSPNS